MTKREQLEGALTDLFCLDQDYFDQFETMLELLQSLDRKQWYTLQEYDSSLIPA